MSGFLDTSMVVRYLVRDIPQMANQAAEVIDGDEDLWVTGVVLAEVGHVLRSTYLLPRESVIDSLSLSSSTGKTFPAMGWTRELLRTHC